MRRHALLLVALAALTTACAAPREGARAASGASEADVHGKRALEPRRGISVGDRAPEFTLAAVPGGERVAMPNGQVTIVVFWATWSAPDRQELIQLQEAFVRNGPAGLAVIGVCVDDGNEYVADFAKKNGLRFPIVRDADKRLTDAYWPGTDPATYIVDREGIVRYRHTGYHEGEARSIEDEAKSLLAREKAAR